MWGEQGGEEMAVSRYVGAALLCLACQAGVAAQATTPVRTTPWGDPDLQGMWPSGMLVNVPFERPEALGTRRTFSADEYDEREKARSARSAVYARTGTGAPPHWSESGTPPPPLASLIVEPENGRLPPMTETGARRAREWRTKSAPTYAYAGPEDLRPYDRCISRGILGSAFPNIYSSVMWIVQIPGFVIISHEMIHETRVIPLDGRPHIAPGIRQWMGDSRGWWEGDTLVIETTNFNGRTGSHARNGDGNPTSEALRLIERIRLRDADTLEYEVRIDDPETWTAPWAVGFPLTRDDDYVIFEYACHEANYALRNMLSIARDTDGDRAP